MAGLAQKGGAVYSHIRIADKPGGHPRHPRRGRRAPIWCSAATSWSPATRRCWPRSSTGATDDGGQHGRVPARRVHPQRRFLAADRAAQARHRGRGRRARRRISSMRPRIATALLGNSIGANMFMRRLRLSARRAAALGGRDRAGDRAQRRGGGDEPGGVPLGPPRRGRSARRSRRWSKPRRRPPSDARQLSQSFDETVARRVDVPHRLPERRLCARATARWSSKAKAAEAAKAPGQDRARRGGRALPVQADGLQGRVRGRAALHRRRIPAQQVAREFDGDNLRFEFHLAPPLLARTRHGDRRAAQDDASGRG